MKRIPGILILTGGIGPEREIALVTGDTMYSALAGIYEVRLVELDGAEVPSEIAGDREIVFPALHGEFGEDGVLQSILEERNILFAGSDSGSSRICIRKNLTKNKVAECGVRVVPGIFFTAPSLPPVDDIVEALGEDLVVKPDDKGSSIGLHLPRGRGELKGVLESLSEDSWLIETRIRGREISVGILNGKALGLVELCPGKGVYDYESKYQEGKTDYRFPAELDPAVEEEIREGAEKAFRVCGCRDFARVDFMLSGENQPYFMEVNTLPGLTPTSLLPKSASCLGYSFAGLAQELVKPAMERFNKALSGVNP